MRQETNKEMDLLLRRLGRRDDATVSNTLGDHLDVDELSAYAENALPAAARARYTAHLVECTRCRELVVQLSASAGVVVSAAETTKVSAPSVWGKVLASLFTPMVLRYAAPALGLIVVAAIGFVVLRRDQPAEYVTQVNDDQQRPAASPAAETASPAVGNPTTTRPSADRLEEKQKKNPETDSAPAPPPNAAPVVGSVQTEASKDAAAAQPKPEQQTASANEARPAKPAPTRAPEEKPRAAEIEVSKQEAAPQPASSRAPERASQSEQRDDRRTKGFSAADQAGPEGAGSAAKLKRSEMNLSANTRSVAGRRFSKKGGVWIDTAYDSSKDAVTLTRGSEQYRALVADEPEIKRIADELDGEILVVWKGRTYRIR